MLRSPAVRRTAHSMLEMAGATAPPIDVERIAALLGFRVVPYDFPDPAISGMLVIEDEVRAIAVNREHHPNRQRFTIAHQIGHFLAGHADEDDADFVDEERFYVDDTFAGREPEEQEANAFATELLMPRHLLERDLADGMKQPAQLAQRYGVSEQALWMQLLDMRLAPALHPTPRR